MYKRVLGKQGKMSCGLLKQLVVRPGFAGG